MPPPVAGQEGHRPPLQAPGDDGVAGRPEGRLQLHLPAPLQVREVVEPLPPMTAISAAGSVDRSRQCSDGRLVGEAQDSSYGGRWTPSSVTIAVT